MSRRLRLTLLAFGGLAVVALLSVVVVVYLVLQPDRFTAMLQTQARAVGLDLSLASPASPTLFPRPALDLHGITLSAEGAGAPILLAARGRMALPWRTLFGGPTVISQLQIDSPRVDLDALQTWMAALPAQPDNA
ncbi:MAG: AsmA family protein, partial [Rhodanobacter sp.]